jgi:hypothetical protein
MRHETMFRAVKIGCLSGVSVYSGLLLIAFVRLVLAQPRFGGISPLPISAIWIVAVWLLPWFVVTSTLVTVVALLASRRRTA